MAASPSSASGTSSPASSSGGAANLLAALGASGGGGGPSASTSDLASKYQKLAAEYSKLRSQFGVVKKAVVDEQARSAQLAEALRTKELSERKRESEMESLTFRNQQLTKRIQVLQEDIESQEQRNKLGKKGPKATAAEAIQSSETLNSVIGRELQAKIDENAHLQSRLSDVDQRYGDLVSSLQDRIKELESDARSRAQAERAEDTKCKDLLAGARGENATLLKQVQELERELVDHQDRVTLLTVQLESQKEGNSPGSAKSIGSFPLTADDVRIQSVELLSQFGDGVTGLVASFSDFHTYWEHRLRDILPPDAGHLSDDAASLSRLLLQNVKFLKPVEEAYQSAMSQVLSEIKGPGGAAATLSLFSSFSQSLKEYVTYAQEAESLTVACLRYESNLYSCPPAQQAFNSQLQASMRSFYRVLVRVVDHLDSAVQAAASADGGPGKDDLILEPLENLSACCSQLAGRAADVAGTYADKSADEDRLPTVTDQLRNTNQCVTSALTSSAHLLGDVSRLLAESMPRIAVLVRAGANLPRAAPTNEGDGSPSPGADKKGDSEKEEMESMESEDLEVLKARTSNLEDLITKMTAKSKDLEQKREHWKLEFQLLQMKYDKLVGDGSNAGDMEENLEPWPLRHRIEEVLGERLLADGKAASFYLECACLRRRLRAAERRRRRAVGRLAEAERRAEALKEEAATTAANYEGQLGLMTEHVAHMNDKLTSQTDEIENLKYQMGKKGKK